MLEAGFGACLPPSTAGRVTRAAVLFAGAAAVGACVNLTPLYGAPAIDAEPAPTDGGASDADADADADDGGEAGGAVALYGPAPVDAGDDGSS